MIKYEIKTDSFEFRMGREKWRIPAMTGAEILDTYFSCDDRITSNSLDPEIRESFDSEEEARAFFAAHYAGHGRTSLQRGNTQYLLLGQLAWLEANEYDADGEFDQADGVLAFSAAPYTPEDDEAEYDDED